MRSVILISLLALAGCLIAGLHFAQLCSFKRRPIYSRRELLYAYGVGEEDYHFLIIILSAVGASYQIDYRKLRPNDSFDGNLKQLDSWILDKGNEELTSKLLSYGVTATALKQIRTVQDVVMLYLKKVEIEKDETSVLGKQGSAGLAP